jgi:repressor LexA
VSRGKWIRGVTDEAVLDFIKSYHGRKGFAPTIREIAEGVGLTSTSAALLHVKHLEAHGRITRAPDTARSIVVVAA